VLRLLNDVATYVNTQCGAGDWTQVFIGNMPDTPVACVAVYPAESPVLSGEVVQRVGFRLVLRGAPHAYPATLRRVELVYEALENKWNQLPNVIGRIAPQHRVGEPFRDSNGNLNWSLAFMCTTYVSTI